MKFLFSKTLKIVLHPKKRPNCCVCFVGSKTFYIQQQHHKSTQQNAQAQGKSMYITNDKSCKEVIKHDQITVQIGTYKQMTLGERKGKNMCHDQVQCDKFIISVKGTNAVWCDIGD